MVGGGGATRPWPHAKPRKGGHHVFCPPKLPKSFYFLLFIFFESEFGSIQKNSGLNSWSFEFWRYPRLEPRAKLHPPPPKTGGWTGLEKWFQRWRGLGLGGPRGKGSLSISKGPKPPIQLLQLLKNSPREVKRDHFRYILAPPGPTQEMELLGPGGEGPSRPTPVSPAMRLDPPVMIPFILFY